MCVCVCVSVCVCVGGWVSGLSEGLGVEGLEACDAGDLLRCMVDVEAGTVEFRIPNGSW